MSGSWLGLERYALGECAPEEAAAIEVLLRSDPDARAILDAIRTDDRALPPLPTPLPRRRSPLRTATAVLLLAAVVLLAVGLRNTGPDGATKGGDLSLELVGLRDGHATPLADVGTGDRLGLRLTCPPGRTRIDVVVFHGGEAAFPIAPTTVVCGNGVAVPAAFSIDRPGPLVACVALGELPPREILAEGPSEASVCVGADVHR